MNAQAKSFIEGEEAKSERIASVAQLLFLCAVFLIYHLSPKGFTNSEFEPVKITFFLYAPVLVLRIYLAWRNSLQAPLLFLFLGLDLVVLTTLIWSFHIQYHRPATLSLRAPAFLYYFIFLSIRSLSFDFRKVLFVLFGSVILWASLLIYALAKEDIFITKNFAEFLLPNTVLIGMEIDKLLTLAIVGGFLTIAILRKEKLLNAFAMKSVKEDILVRLIGRQSLSNFDLDSNELSVGQGMKRNAATMMIDLRNFTALSYRLPPGKLLAYLREYQSIVVEIIFKHGGSIDKYLGDGILAHFGAVKEDPNFAKAALETAEDIDLALNEWKSGLAKDDINIDFGIAITVGEVIFGVIGHEERMEITTIGESVNLAAKLEKHTKRLNCPIILTQKLLILAESQGYKPQKKVQVFTDSNIEGIPHSLNIVGLI